jgi:hypothetical protein
MMVYVFHINTDDNKNEWFPPSNSSGKIISMQGDGQVILKIQNLHLTKQNTSCGSLTSVLVML